MRSSLYTKDVKLILIASFFFLMNPMLINPVIAGFASKEGASGVLAGVIAGATNLTSLLLRPVAGNLTDLVSKYHLTTVGGSMFVLASLGYSLTTNLQLIIVCRIATGIGYTLCSVCMATWMASLLPANKIGSGMGIYGLANAMGMAVGPALAVYLYAHFSYQLVFLTSAGCSLLMLILIQFVSVRGVPKPSSVKHSKKLRIVQPKVLPVALILMLFSLPYFATQTYIVSYISQRHFSVPAGAFFPIYAMILLGLRLGLRNLFDSVPFRKFFWICLGCNFVGVAALIDLDNWLMLVIAALGLAAGYGLMYSICQAKALTLVPASDRGLANSTFYIGIDLGMTLGPMFGGLISSLLPWKWFYPVMFVTLPFVVLVYYLDRRGLA